MVLPESSAKYSRNEVISILNKFFQRLEKGGMLLILFYEARVNVEANIWQGKYEKGKSQPNLSHE